MASKQQHYRRLMKEQKGKSSSEDSKVDHPLAKYNSLGQLMCVICSQQVKSNILWPTHLKSRKHKDAVGALKSSSAAASQKSAMPRPPPVPEATPSMPSRTSRTSPGREREYVAAVAGQSSTRKRDLPEETPSTSANMPPSKKKKSKHKPDSSDSVSSGLPADFFDAGVKKKFYGKGDEPMYDLSDDEDLPPIAESTDQSNGRPKIVIDKIIPAAPTPAGLPSDFFDAPSQNTESEKDATSGEAGGKGSLPEGFFDDPKQDAKARKVEYKDPILEEWEKFQKSIQKEDDISEALLVEGDEEAMEDRELEEVNEQVRCFTKAEELRLKHEEFLSAQKTRAKPDEGEAMDVQPASDEDDDDDFDEFLNWRDKVS